VFANIKNFLVINIFLAVFNMLPMPPFDGGHVVEGLLPRPLAARYAKLGKYGFLLLILLLVVVPMVWPKLNVIEWIVVPPVKALLGVYLSLAGIA
jgi:Zn-dependent protease